MTKVNSNSENETKPDICLWDVFKSDVIDFLSKNTFKYFNDFQNRIFFSFMTKVNQNNGNETKLGIFSLDIFKLDIIFNWPQNTKIF